MSMITEWSPARVLITAKTYPAPAKKGVEVSCTGGITEQGDWIRLFPVPFRLLEQEKQFKKYQWVRVLPVKTPNDRRPESFKLDLDSIVIEPGVLSTADAWKARKQVVMPLESPSLCWLQAQRDAHGSPTLGFFKPKVISRLIIEPDSRQWTPGEIARLGQYPLFGKSPESVLEKIPYQFKYEFICEQPGCRGHEMSCLDWEIRQSYRKWSRQYGTAWEEKFRQRYEQDMIERSDTYFFVGTLHQFPGTWIIIGLFYPPKVPDLADPVAIEPSTSVARQVALF
jgi:hypothetical protein